MRPVRQLVCVALLSAVAAGLSAAATQPPQGKGGGRGGFGGGGPLALLQSKTVRDEVKITEDQTAKLKDVRKDLQEKVGTVMREKMQGIAREDMMKEMPKIQAEISEVVYKELADVLKPEQIARMKEIEVQTTGLQAFAQPRVKTALKITDEQGEKLQAIQGDTMKEMRDLGEEYGSRFPGQRPTDPDKAKEFDKKAAAITKESMDKVMALMSAEQKAAYKKLSGEPVDVAKIRTETMGAPRPKKVDD